jgi:hypothetical protein
VPKELDSYIPEDGIFHNYGSEDLKSFISVKRMECFSRETEVLSAKAVPMPFPALEVHVS